MTTYIGTTVVSEERKRRGRNSQKRGAKYERDVAEIMGGRRHKANAGGGEDIEHPEYAVQCKSGGRVVTEIMRDGMASAKVAALGKNKLPALVLVDRRGTRLQRYIVFELEAWCDWNGIGGSGEGDDD